MTRWEFVVPQLPVRDVPSAQRWYQETLGLGINWLWQDNFGSVGEGNVELFLYETEEPRPVIVSAFVDDADALYALCHTHGADICSEIETKPWGVREFSVRDPDGNVLRIGHEEEAAADLSQLSLSEARNGA